MEAFVVRNLFDVAKQQFFASRPNPFISRSRFVELRTVAKLAEPFFRFGDKPAQMVKFQIENNAAPELAVAFPNVAKKAHKLGNSLAGAACAFV